MAIKRETVPPAVLELLRSTPPTPKRHEWNFSEYAPGEMMVIDDQRLFAAAWGAMRTHKSRTGQRWTRLGYSEDGKLRLVRIE